MVFLWAGERGEVPLESAWVCGMCVGEQGGRAQRGRPRALAHGPGRTDGEANPGRQHKNASAALASVGRWPMPALFYFLPLHAPL